MKTTHTPKVLYIITKSVWFGAQRYVYDLATELQGVYDVVVALGGSGELKTRLEAAGIRTVQVRTFQRDIHFIKEARAFAELFRIIWRERPDVVHVNSSKAGGLGAVAARLLGVHRVIFTVHGWPFREQRGRTARMLIVFFSWLTAFFAHRVILIADVDMRAAERMPFLRGKCVLIHNGRAPLSFASRAAAQEYLKVLVPSLRNDSPRGVWVGTVGELTRNKAFDALVWAMRSVVDMFPKARCVIAGEGEEYNTLERLIGHLGLSQQVFLVGYVDTARVLPALDVFVLPSLKEGLPYTVLEAGQAGLPVIASTTGGIPEVITDEASGILVRPGDADEVARALELLFRNQDKRKKYGKALKKAVTERFSLERMLERTAALYHH
ncbi:glycosyltransferase family 4 protein [Candidatus Wolfebacteria bacterium]|nr:glycosyltransferase family 4 protein [Candidatus Wolfebacteria bacterium]